MEYVRKELQIIFLKKKKESKFILIYSQQKEFWTKKELLSQPRM